MQYIYVLCFTIVYIWNVYRIHNYTLCWRLIYDVDLFKWDARNMALTRNLIHSDVDISMMKINMMTQYHIILLLMMGIKNWPQRQSIYRFWFDYIHLRPKMIKRLLSNRWRSSVYFFPISIVSSYHLFSHLYSYPMDNKCITLMIHSVHIKGKLYRFILFPWKNSRHNINSITADIERLVYIFHLFFISYNILLISQYFTPRAYM
jgi:hypothetical protein